MSSRVESMINQVVNGKSPDAVIREAWPETQSDKMTAVNQKSLMDFLKQGSYLQATSKDILDRIYTLKGKPLSDVESRELQSAYGEQRRISSAIVDWLKRAEKTYPDYGLFIDNAKKLGYKDTDLP